MSDINEAPSLDVTVSSNRVPSWSQERIRSGKEAFEWYRPRLSPLIDYRIEDLAKRCNGLILFGLFLIFAGLYVLIFNPDLSAITFNNPETEQSVATKLENQITADARASRSVRERFPNGRSPSR